MYLRRNKVQFMKLFNKTKQENHSNKKNTIKEATFFGDSNLTISALFPSQLSKVFGNSAVWAAVRYLSQTISTFPIHLYEKDKENRKINYEHPVSNLLNTPNKYMTKSTFFETMIINLELFGIAYAEITFSSNNYPLSVFPIAPNDIYVSVENGTLTYTYTPTGDKIPSENLLIIMGSSTSGFFPLKPIHYMDNLLDSTRAGEELQKRYLERGTIIGGVINVPDSYSNEDKRRLKTNFDTSFGGNNAYSSVVLSNGVTYEPLKFSAEQQQLIQTREFNIQEVARRFGVSPYVLGDLSHATFSNVEQQALQELRTTLLPRIIKIEEALNNKLFSNKDKRRYSIKFNMDGFLRGDTKNRYEAYGNAIQNGWMNINEVRALENLNPVDDGNTFFVPLNYVSREVATKYIPANYSQTAQKEEVETVKEEIKEELLTESYFIEERREISFSSKKKIERLTSKMLKKEIEEIERQLPVLNSQGIQTFKNEVNSSIGKISLEYSDEFKEIFNEISVKINKSLMKQLSKDKLSDEESLKEFIEKYTSSFIHRHSGNIVHAIIKTSEKTTPAEAENDFKETINKLKQDLPRETAEEESVRSSNAFIKAAAIGYGLTKLKAVVAPDACDFCKQLEGKVFGVEGNLISKGNTMVDSEGNKVEVKKNYSHFPIHKGCKCFISPSL